jgi:TonB-linked SusC/RagA family outer membrane protein
MRKFTFLMALLTLFGFNAALAQKTITGTVTSSEDGSPIPGVQVVVKSTTVGTTTDLEGNYELRAPEDAETLVFMFVGMVTQEVTIGDQNIINVVLEPEIQALEGVVVTALGVSREKKSLGYAIQEVSGDELNRAKNENVINSMSGKVAGVQIKANTNMGGSSNVLIRGSSSLLGNNQALFVVDGVPVNNQNTNTSYQSRGGSGYDYGNPVADINPNDIESTSVLKGAAATALYGSRAANGVILITTKKGKATKGKELNISLNHSTMFHSYDKETFPEYQDQYGGGYGPYYSGTEYSGLYYYDFDGDGTNDYVVPTTEDASRGSAFNPDLNVFQWDAFYPESPTYMQKSPYVAGANDAGYFFETGRTFTTNFDVSGGNEKATFRMSYTNTDETGIMPNSELKKNNLNFNGSYSASDNLKFSASANYTNTYTKGRNHTGYSDNIMSMFRQWYNVGVDMKMQEDYYNLTGKNLTWNPHSENDLSPIYWDNPYWQRYENYQSDERDRVIGYAKMDWDITEDLSFMARYSLDHYNFLQEERKAVGSVAGAFGVGYPDVQSGYARNTINFTETNFDAMLRYHRDITESINLNALAGANFRRTYLETLRASTNGGLAVPGVYALSNSVNQMLPPEEAVEEVGVDGVYASASFGFYDMVFVDLTARNDWSSTLPEDNRSYFYPSVSTSFLFSELLDVPELDLGKIRLNYAQVGNDAEWGSVLDFYRIVTPFSGNTIARLTTFKNNPDLKPELSESYEAGLELVGFNNRLGLDVAVYRTNTTNQFVPLAVSSATGYSSKIVNVGEVRNEGIELQLRGTPIKNKDFSWDVILNWATNNNEVVSLGGDIQNLQLAGLQGGVTINAREGEPYGVIQGTDFVYSPDGRKVVSPSGYYVSTGTSDIVLGSVQPDWNAGLSNTLNYKGFSLSFLIDVQMGGSIFSLDQWYGMGTGLYPETVENNDLGNQERDPVIQTQVSDYVWEDDPASGGILLDGVVGIDENGDGEYDSYVENTKRISGFNYGADGWATSPNGRYIYDATYVKLREASLSYMLPKNLLNNTFISSATVSIIGSNLWIIYKDLPYADPEASQGAGNVQGWQSGVLPTARNIGFSVNLTF